MDFGVTGKTDGTDKGGNKPACESAGSWQRRAVGFDHIEVGGILSCV